MLFFWGFVLVVLKFITSINTPKQNLVHKVSSDRETSFDRVLVEVYYESMCIDSKHFIQQQLVPVANKIPEIIDFRLIPYGKANTIENTTGIFFSCQHKELECQGNKIHACAIKYIEDKSKQLGFVSCLINYIRNPQLMWKMCATADWEKIQECFQSREGSELLKSYGEETHSLKPSMTFVPTVVINKSHGHQKGILRNLRKEICSLYTGTKPSPCL